MADVERRVQLVRFGDFEVDLRSGELRKAGVKLKFGGQPFQVRTILLKQPGEVVTREVIRSRFRVASRTRTAAFSIDGIEKGSGRSFQDGTFRKASMSSMPRPASTSSNG